jgi:hypothetical protein
MRGGNGRFPSACEAPFVSGKSLCHNSGFLSRNPEKIFLALMALTLGSKCAAPSSRGAAQRRRGDPGGLRAPPAKTPSLPYDPWIAASLRSSQRRFRVSGICGFTRRRNRHRERSNANQKSTGRPTTPGSPRRFAPRDDDCAFERHRRVYAAPQPSSRAERRDSAEHRAPYAPLDRPVAKARLKDGRLSTPYGSSR